MIIAALIAPLLTFVSEPAQAVAPTCAQGGVCQVGDTGPGGGKVFYVAPDDGTFTQVGATDSMCSTDCKYLEAAPTTGGSAWTDASYVWSGNTNTGVGTTGTDIGTGYRNTKNIVAQSNTADRAGTKSLAYRGPNSLSDWYLPSKDELNQLYLQRVTVGASIGTVFVNGTYASSSESSANNIYFHNFYDGNQNIGGKLGGHKVRPIRAFGLERAPTKVAVTRAPVRTLTPNTVFASQPQITIQDVNSRTVSSSAVVTATISSGGTLVGTTTATASDGVATFSNLGVNGTVGSTYTITYTAVGLTVATATVTLTGTTCDGSTLNCQVGDFGPGGGLIFYVSTNGFRCGPTLSSVCKYLEAAREGWFDGGADPRRTWATNTNSNQTTAVTGADGTAIGTGYQNSLDIVAQTGNVAASSAAALARSYTGPNNLTDWYLPSKNELREITIKQDLLAATAGYWSSSEISATKAWDEGNNYNQGQANKSSSTPVRPIRAFGTITAISSAAIAGVTAPVAGASPVTAVTPGTGYTGTVSWSTAPSTFAALTTYTATITLTATAGYSLIGVNANFFTVSGATSVTHAADSGVISAAFPATAAGPATKALMTTQPSGAVSGAAFTTQPVVRVTDVNGNTNTSFTGNVVASIATGTGTLGGTTTVAAVSGIATFTDLGILGLGNFTLRFTPASLTAVDSSSFALEAAPVATKVAITRAAVGTQRRTAFTTQPQITIQFSNNDTVTASSAVVTASISSGGTLIGTTTATASSGVATFSNLGVDGTIGSTYTITYTAVDLTVATATVTLTGTTCDGATFTCQVGDTGPGGGKIFYVAPTTFTQLGATGFMCSTACKYLEAAPTSGTNAWTDAFYRWSGNINTLIGTTGTAIGTGYKNTLAIVAQSNTSDRAATVSRGYRGPNSLSDWFLPSKNELNELYMQKAFVGSFQENYYWSSSESDATSSFDQNFLGGSQGTTLKNGEDYVRPIRAFGTTPTSISVFAIGGVTAPVSGATPVSTVTAANGYTGTVTWSGSPTTFASSTIYTATITLTAAAGYTLAGVGANSYTVAGATSVTHSADSGIVTAAFPTTAAPTAAPVVAVAPTPVPYLKTLTTPKLRLSAGKLLCTPGTYNAGYTLDGVIQGSTTNLFTPSSFTYNLLINGVTQTSLGVTSASFSNSWNLSTAAPGSLIACSVTVSANSLSNTDKSSDNTSGASPALTTQSTAIASANATYSAALSVNTKAYQKALVDNRTQWRSTTEKIRTDYYAERNRINSLPSTKATRALSSAALKAYTAALKKSAADYKASGPAALAAKDVADKAALDAKTTAIAKANVAYGTAIESIGFGVLIP